MYLWFASYVPHLGDLFEGEKVFRSPFRLVIGEQGYGIVEVGQVVTVELEGLDKSSAGYPAAQA